MPQKNDVTVEGDDEHGYTVFQRVRVNSRQSKRGARLGSIRRLPDGTYEPVGTAAMFGYPTPALTVGDALEAFIGWD